MLLTTRDIVTFKEREDEEIDAEIKLYKGEGKYYESKTVVGENNLDFWKQVNEMVSYRKLEDFEKGIY